MAVRMIGVILILMEVVLFTVVMVVWGIKIQTEADRIMVQMIVGDTKIPMVAVLFMMRMVVGGVQKCRWKWFFLWRNGRQ